MYSSCFVERKTTMNLKKAELDLLTGLFPTSDSDSTLTLKLTF